MKVLVIYAWESPFVHHQIKLLRAMHDVETLRINHADGPRIVVAISAIIKGLLWKSKPIDVVHSYSAWPAGIAGCVIAMRSCARHVVHEHLSPPKRLTRLPFVRSVISLAHRVVSPSKPHADEIEGIFQRPVSVVRNPVITGNPQPYWITAKTKVVMIGRLEPQKGFSIAPELSRLLPDYSFFIVGGGSQYRRIFMDSPPNLYMRSPCNFDEAMRWIATADIVLCPSEHESFGMVAAEACKLGKRVVATAVGSHSDYATVIVQPGAKAEDIAAAIVKAGSESPRAYSEPPESFVDRMSAIYEPPLETP